MGFYYYGVMPKYKALIRIGHSHFDGDGNYKGQGGQRNLRIAFREPSDEDYINLEALSDMFESNVGDIVNMNVGDLAKAARAVDLATSILDWGMIFEWSVWYLFREYIEEVIGEDKLDDYKDWPRLLD